MNDFIGYSKCEWCGAMFPQETPYHLFCDRECYRKWIKANKGKQPTKLIESFSFDCQYCGKVVVTDPSQKDRRYKYCGYMCYHNARNDRKQQKKNTVAQTYFSTQNSFEYYERKTNREWGG